jgi:hypothetical protein
MARESRFDKRSKREAQQGSSVVPILLILGLALGIPAVIGVLVLALIFGAAFFVTKKTRELGEQVVAEANDRQKELQEAARQRQQEEAARFKEQQDAAKQNALRIRQEQDKLIAEQEARVREQQEAFKKKFQKFPQFPPPDNPFEKKDVVVKPPPPTGVPGKKQYDLIALIDPSKDAVENRRWEIIDKELHCKDGSFVPRMEIPYRPPEEYDFIVTFSQPGLRNGISLIMPNPRGGSFFFHIGDGDGSNFGFAGKPANFDGQAQGLIRVNTAYTTTVQVRRDGVRALLNGKELSNLKTDFSNLTCDNWRQIRDTKLLAVACDDPTVFHYVQIVEITGAGQRTR